MVAPPSVPRPLLRRLVLAVILLVVLASTLLAAVHLRAGEDRAARSRGQERAAIARTAVEGDLGLALGVMAQAREVLAVPQGADGRRIRALARGPLLSDSSFVALTWNPRVLASERADFERRLGRPLTEAGVSGLRTAGRRDEYLPVLFVHGRDADGYLGADESSLPVLGMAVAEARDTGKVRVADPLPLGPAGAPTARAYMPVFRRGARPTTPNARRAAFLGFVGASIDVDRLAGVARSSLGDGRVRLVTGPGDIGSDPAEPVAGTDWQVVVPAPAPSRVGSTLAWALGAALAVLVGFGGLAARRGRSLTRRLAERGRVEEDLRRRERMTRSIAEEHAAFRAIATSIAAEVDPEEVYRLVARTVGTLLGADAGSVARFDDDGVVRLVGCWGDGAGAEGAPAAPDGAAAAVRRSHVAERVVHRDAAGEICGVEVAVPVRVGGRLWGAVAARALAAETLAGEGTVRLVGFAELLEIGVAGVEARRRLAEQASRDGLTGLVNHRVFHERLRDEISRARRHGRPLGLALIDLDHFKDVNDTHGHQAGDQVLTAVARTLARHARAGDVLARVGGEEFAWLMPETDGLAAFAAAERARQAVAATDLAPVGRITVSAGVAELDHSLDGAELYRRADDALYWAKSHGRDLSCRYSAEIVATPDETEDGGEDEGLIALVEAVERREDAAGHAARVAALSGRIAARLGWQHDAIARLTRAARLHDIGKIAVAESVLGRPGPLSAEERALVSVHPELGARIAAATLAEDQVAWIRGHHERWDGAGGPDGLRGDDIPAGARIIAVAETWDALTVRRPYTTPRTLDEALDEVRRAAGAQLCPLASGALLSTVSSAGVPTGTITSD